MTAVAVGALFKFLRYNISHDASAVLLTRLHRGNVQYYGLSLSQLAVGLDVFSFTISPSTSEDNGC